MKLDDKIRLQHMLDAAQEAVTFLNSLNGENIENNRLVSQAIVRLIEVVGEAAAQLSKEYKNSHPKLSWAQIIGMRNRIVHAYFDIDYSLVESLIVCPANLSFQWQRELKEKFDEKFVVLKGGDIRDQFGVNQWMEHKKVRVA